MGYKRHIFYQPECDYPDCGKLLHVSNPEDNPSNGSISLRTRSEPH